MLLSGVRVLDLTRVLAGPLCTMLLGDLGADVLKVERPGEGDETRGWGPPFDERGESAYYLSINRNKLGLAADLDAAGDVALLRALAADADVVVENFRRGALARRGLDPAVLLAENPRLVWCTISGFGPDSDRPGYDFVLQAEQGWMAVNGAPDGEPVKAPVAVVDVLTGKDAAIAILGALVGRSGPRAPLPAAERHVRVSLAASAVAGLVNVAQNVLVSGRDARRWGNAHANLSPYQLLDAADRPLVVAVGNDAQWRACAAALDLPELAADPRFATNPARLANRDALVALLSGRLRTRPAAEWRARLDAAGVPAGEVRSVAEALRDVDASPLIGVAPSVPGRVRRPPPRLDEHGALVRALGWGAFGRVAPLP
ncbi:CoA transferase [Roseisolibacter sp. H3M3-2]|uniref:CaiB/BaiF CoA transferase family protein n=1 Tax=Roseisolibacter sp. H3M3-2 TaxID=3031323 RepID=UPI0023DBE0A8|nr:CoA transferase [Roseisolibacter sp. H3M3-2]MDF1501667.1 CoA transferase [Roseisolibacter sp. H3M3-2]